MYCVLYRPGQDWDLWVVTDDEDEALGELAEALRKYGTRNVVFLKQKKFIYDTLVTYKGTSTGEMGPA